MSEFDDVITFEITTSPDMREADLKKVYKVFQEYHAKCNKDHN